LTARLKDVTEGRSQEAETTNEGLGIKIVTVQIREALVSSEKLWQDLQAPFRHQQETAARISYLNMQDEIRQKELEARQAAETSEAETMVEIERTKQTKQTEALDLRLTEEATRFTKEQETTRDKIQLEEDTTAARRESEQRLQAQAATMEQERELATLARDNERLLEQARLNDEASRRQKTLEIEAALHTITEDNRLAAMELEAAQQRLEREETLKTQEAAVSVLLQEQADALQAQILESRLAREKEAHEAKLALEEEANRVKIALQEKEVEITRLQQEVRNLVSDPDLMSRLIDKLPELAAEMPEIQELRVLQTGNNNTAFDSLSAFLAQMMALADSLGISVKKDGTKSIPTNSDGDEST